MTDLAMKLDTSDMERDLRRFELLIADLRSFWPSVVPLFIGWMKATFESEGGSIGRRWSPLSPAYAVAKAKAHPGRSILIASGDLRQAASRPKRTATAHSLTLSIEDDKAGFHQTGTRKMPARPLIPDRLPHSALAELDRAAEEYVRDALHRSGLGGHL